MHVQSQLKRHILSLVHLVHCLLVPGYLTFCHPLLLLVGVLSIVPVFCGLVGRGRLGRVCHCGEVVSHRDASRDDPFHGGRKSARGHAHDPWRVSKEHREGPGKSRVEVAMFLALPTSGLLYEVICHPPYPQSKEALM